MMKKIAIAVLIFLSSVNIHAQPKSSLPQNSNVTTASQSSPQSEEVSYLKALLDTEKKHNEDVLQTVYWALGFVGGITLLIVGFGWYNANSMHDRDIKSIKSEVALEQSEKLNTALADLTKILNERIEKDISSGLESSATANQRAIKVLTAQISEIDFNLRFHKHEIEIRYWIQRNVPQNVLLVHRHWLHDAKQAKDDYQIRDALAGIQKWLETEAPVDAEVIPDYITALADLPDEFSINVQTIRRLLAHRNAR